MTCLVCGATRFRDKELCEECWRRTPSVTLAVLATDPKLRKPGDGERRAASIQAKAQLMLARHAPVNDPARMAHLRWAAAQRTIHE